MNKSKYLVNPQAIEKKSMELIEREIQFRNTCPIERKVIKRVIHATADFDFAEILFFNHSPIQCFFKAIDRGMNMVCDTRMIQMGINSGLLDRLNLCLNCFVSNPDVVRQAKELGITRAMVSMDKAVKDSRNLIFIIGNSPTALYRLLEHIRDGFAPALIIGVPVGFVGAAESKELIRNEAIPSITSIGRKGGSTVAAAIVNALLFHYISISA